MRSHRERGKRGEGQRASRPCYFWLLFLWPRWFVITNLGDVGDECLCFNTVDVCAINRVGFSYDYNCCGWMTIIVVFDPKR